MTEKDLSLYKSMKSRVDRNERKIEELRCKDFSAVSGKVKGSLNVFPYIETHFSVQMEDAKEVEVCKEQICKLERTIASDREKISNIEKYINSIKDLGLQSIFEMRIFDGLNWADIAAEMDEDKDRTTYSKRFRNYIICSHNSPTSH